MTTMIIQKKAPQLRPLRPWGETIFADNLSSKIKTKHNWVFYTIHVKNSRQYFSKLQIHHTLLQMDNKSSYQKQRVQVGQHLCTSIMKIRSNALLKWNIIYIWFLVYKYTGPFCAQLYHPVLLERKSCSNVCISSTCFTIFVEGTNCFLRSRIVERGILIFVMASV